MIYLSLYIVYSLSFRIIASFQSRNPVVILQIYVVLKLLLSSPCVLIILKLKYNFSYLHFLFYTISLLVNITNSVLQIKNFRQNEEYLSKPCHGNFQLPFPEQILYLFIELFCFSGVGNYTLCGIEKHMLKPCSSLCMLMLQ